MVHNVINLGEIGITLNRLNRRALAREEVGHRRKRVVERILIAQAVCLNVSIRGIFEAMHILHARPRLAPDGNVELAFRHALVWLARRRKEWPPIALVLVGVKAHMQDLPLCKGDSPCRKRIQMRQ